MPDNPLGYSPVTSKTGTLNPNRLTQPDQVMPDVSLQVFPRSDIKHRVYPGFVVADLLGDQMNMGMGDSPGLDFISSINPTISDSWLQGSGLQQKDFTDIQGLNFVRLANDGRFYEGDKAKANKVGGMAGFILQGREGFLDCKIRDDEELDTDNANQHFAPVQGEWETVLPPESPQRTFIRPVGSGLTHIVQSEGDIPADRSMRFDLRFVGQGKHDVQPAFRIVYGYSNFSVLFRQGAPITFEQFVGNNWYTLRQFSDAPLADLRKNNYVVRIRHIAGRTVISINGSSFHHLHTTKNSDNRTVPVDAVWPEGPVQFNCYNCRPTIGLGVIKYADAGDTPYDGQFSRYIRCNAPVKHDEQTNPVKAETGGWKRGGEVEVATDFAQGYCTYTCKLTGSNAGIYTPFISKVLLRFTSGWQALGNNALQLRPFINTITLDGAVPQLSPDMSLSVELDLAQLSKAVPNWRNTLQKYCPVHLSVAIRYADNSKEPEQGLFRGYIFTVRENFAGFNAGTLSLQCRGRISRLQKPAAVIDHRYPPLDFLFAFKEGAAIYGGDCVKEILRVALGDDEATALNGNGDPLRYFNNHYPLIDFSGDTCGYFTVINGIKGQPPTQGSFMFPPPFGEDALNWIKKIAEYDYAVFLYGWPQGYDGTWPVPMYGRWQNIMAGRRNWTIYDKEYVSGNLQYLIKSYETETRPEKDINRVLVWANPGGVTAPEFIPSYRMAEARLPATNPNASEYSWERTHVIKEDLGSPPGGAEALAQGAINLLSDVDMIWPTVTLRGYNKYQWGDTVTFQLTDAIVKNNPEINGKTFRVEKVHHSIDFKADNGEYFTTQLSLRPGNANWEFKR